MLVMLMFGMKGIKIYSVTFSALRA
jgi:hypothetical protein